MRGEARRTRLRLMRDMKSRRKTTLLKALSVPVAERLVGFGRAGEGLTASKEAVELDEELDVDVVPVWIGLMVIFGGWVRGIRLGRLAVRRAHVVLVDAGNWLAYLFYRDV